MRWVDGYRPTCRYIEYIGKGYIEKTKPFVLENFFAEEDLRTDILEIRRRRFNRDGQDSSNGQEVL